MVQSIARAGGRGRYVGGALVHHPVPADRLTRSYARRFAWRQGALSVDLLRRETAAAQADTCARLPRWVYLVSARQVFAGMRQWSAGLLSANPGTAFAGQFTALFGFSKLCHALVGRE